LGHGHGKVLVTAPRRVAVRAAARRLAQLDGSRVGQKVGFSIRGEQFPGTHVDFMPPGVLLRRPLHDPELPGVGAVAIAEVDGQKVGFSIRGEYFPGTHVEFMTPGVLLRRLLNDPELPGVGAVAIDEVHERQLDTDIVLAMLLELAELRDDLSLVAMSATLDAQRFAELMNASVLATPA